MAGFSLAYLLQRVCAPQVVDGHVQTDRRRAPTPRRTDWPPKKKEAVRNEFVEAKAAG